MSGDLEHRYVCEKISHIKPSLPQEFIDTMRSSRDSFIDARFFWVGRLWLCIDDRSHPSSEARRIKIFFEEISR